MKRSVCNHAGHLERRRHVLACCLHLLVFACLLLAATQGMYASSNTGSIGGRVTDTTGGALPGATVTATNSSTGIQQTTTTNQSGIYSFSSLAVDRYDIEISLTAFKVFIKTGVILDVNSEVAVDAMLQVGNTTEHITVSADVLQAETTNTQLGEVINEKKIVSVPLNGRSYTDLLSLQPGVAPQSVTTNSGIPENAPSGGLNTGNISVNGGREDSNGFTLNGGTVTNSVTNGAAIIPNLDSIAEFRILTANFDAEYGSFSGGQINVVTKSGTNAFHGTAFEFLRNTDLDAKSYYDPQRGKFNQNQFGGVFGGPIKRDRVFFFGDYQGTRQVVGQSTGAIPVPSAADRAGDLSDIADQLTGTVTGSYWANQLSQLLGYPVAIGESYYTAGCATPAQCVFPNATVPQSAFASPAGPLLKYIPQPNVGTNIFSTSAYNETLNDDKFGVRVDGNTRLGLLSAYYFYDKFNQSNPYFGNLPGFSYLNDGLAQMINLGDVKTLGSNAVNEFRFQYIQNNGTQGSPVGGLGPSPSDQGFVQGGNGIYPVLPTVQGVVQVSFNDYSFGASGPTAHLVSSSQWLDNFSKVIRAHTLKMGGTYTWQVMNAYVGSYANGSFNFTGQETGSDTADFLVGAPSYFAQGQFESAHDRAFNLGLYAQDSWRAQPHLTINYGLRWDVITPWWERNNRVNTLIPGQQSLLFPTAPAGILFPGDPGIPKTTSPIRYNNFAPRIGVAYAPSASDGFLKTLLGEPGRTSIRAGFGLFYSSQQGYSFLYLTGDAPYGLYYSAPTSPLFATPFVDRETGHVEGQKFPVTFPSDNVSRSNPNTSVPWSLYEPLDVPGYYPGNKTSYVEQYNLTLQRQFAKDTLLTVGYVGSGGHRLLGAVEANPGDAPLCLSVSQASQVAPDSPTCGPFGENGVYTSSTGQVINGTRPTFGNAFAASAYYRTLANSNYNSLQVTLNHSTRRLSFLLGYTFSKSLDDASGSLGSPEGGQINFQNARLSYALSSFDVPHNFVASYNYLLPFDQLFHENRLTGGWTLSGITHFASGFPVVLMETDDQALVGTCNNGPGSCLDTPNYDGQPIKMMNPRKQDLTNLVSPYFSTANFTTENLGQLGTAARAFFYGPGLNNWDMALLKNLNLTESKSLELRFEFFNVFNHAQFGGPSGNINSSSFGFVTTAGPGRIGQVAAKIHF